MNEIRKQQEDLLGIHGFIALAVTATIEATWGEDACKLNIDVAGDAAYVETRTASFSAAGIPAVDATWNLLREEVKGVVSAAMQSDLNLEITGIEKARAALKYVITNEEKIAVAIRNGLKMIKMNEQIDYKLMFHHLLAPSLTKMNLGGKCWYMARVLRLMKMVNYEYERDKLLSMMRSDKVANKFLEWIIGIDCNFKVFDLACGLKLPVALVMMVHGYLDAPAWEQVREKVLRII